jgi:coproporphyrinogen III oxidase
MTPTTTLDRSTYARPHATDRERATAWTVRVHDRLTELFTTLDGGETFREDPWAREGGGGGVSRVLLEGRVFEKAGVNRSTVEGLLPAEVWRRLGGRGEGEGAMRFFASGVSVVAHPRSPKVPTVHLNVRYFELADLDGRPVDAWFGGGTDLTPMWPHADDARHFHRALRGVCDGFHAGLYPRFKPWCDDYFVNKHREGERRGVGGIFYDHVRPAEDASGMPMDTWHAFAEAVGTSLVDAYGPIVERRRGEAYGEAARALQLERRGRYAEFNLLHDRGTLFGLQTNARIESVLMSLPPLAAWPYDPQHAPGTPGAELRAMLVPQDWAA